MPGRKHPLVTNTGFSILKTLSWRLQCRTSDVRQHMSVDRQHLSDDQPEYERKTAGLRSEGGWCTTLILISVLVAEYSCCTLSASRWAVGMPSHSLTRTGVRQCQKAAGSMQGTRSVQPFARESRTTCSNTGSGLCLKNIPSCSRILL